MLIAPFRNLRHARIKSWYFAVLKLICSIKSSSEIKKHLNEFYMVNYSPTQIYKRLAINLKTTARFFGKRPAGYRHSSTFQEICEEHGLLHRHIQYHTYAGKRGGGYLVVMKICLSGLYLLVLTGKLGEQGRNYFYSTLGLIA